MKIKTAVISIVVSAALVAGAGYGAYFAMQGKKSPVEVVPVSNVNTGGYWGTENSIYGSVTSQVAQNITLNEEYPIAEIYVEQGDWVEEGTPLFAYDMTLQELELEMEQLTLQVYELTMTKLEKDLQKLKQTPASASLQRDGSFLTTASDEVIMIEEPEVQEKGSDSEQTEGTSEGTASEKSEASTETSEEKGDSKQEQEAEDTITIEEIETVEESSASSQEEKALLAVIDSAASYQQVVTAIDSLFRAYGSDLKSDEVAGAIKDAFDYYLKHLAEEQVSDVTDSDGNPVQKKEYVIRASVQTALGEEGTDLLLGYSKILEQYQILCTKMMLTEAVSLEGEALLAAVEKAESFYSDISTEGQKEADYLEQMTVLKEQAMQQMQQTELEDVFSDVMTEEISEESMLDAQPLEESTETDEQTEGIQEHSETSTENSAQSESETTTEKQSEITEETSYEIQVQSPGSANVASALAGELIVLHTDAEVPGAEFAGWTAETWSTQEDGTAVYTALDLSSLENMVPEQTETTFVMPAMNVKLIPNYRIVPSEVEGFITTFEELAAKVFEEGAQEDEAYLTMLGDAIDFYQQWLAEAETEILDETAAVPAMQQYQLKTDTKEYLISQNREGAIEELQDTYKKICITYVKTLVSSLDAKQLTREAWEKANKAYENLGASWQEELEEIWLQEQMENQDQPLQDQSEVQTEEAGMEDQTDPGADQEPADTQQEILTLYELLQVYDMILTIMELDLTKTEELLVLDLVSAYEKYQELTDAQQKAVWNASVLLDALEQYHLLEQQETEAPSGDDDFGFDGGDFSDDSEFYTAEELKLMIREKEMEIKECDLSIREAELIVKQCQRIVDGKVVKSTMEGTVVSIGDLDGNADGDYFAKITNEEGLYAKGAMNELALETIHVGDTISGMMMDTGVSFTAVIKEISPYPNANKDDIYYGYGTENSNASYYPFYALLDDTTDIEEGEAEIQLSDTLSSSADAIYLEKYFIRSDNTGKSYVFIQGEDGKLKKQYVTTGKLMFGFAMEIVSGLDITDKIAFPYGKHVFEGAATKEVDMLSDYL